MLKPFWCRVSAFVYWFAGLKVIFFVTLSANSLHLFGGGEDSILSRSRDHCRAARAGSHVYPQRQQHLTALLLMEGAMKGSGTVLKEPKPWRLLQLQFYDLSYKWQI